MKRNFLHLFVLCLLFIGLVAGLSIAIHSIFLESTPGLDLYIYWVAGRNLLLEGNNPYSEQVSSQIQLGIHGRLALPGEDPMRFAYPLFSLLLVAPLLQFSFDWAQAIWLSFSILSTFVLLRLTVPHTPHWIPVSTIFFYPVVFGLILGNYVVLISSILIYCSTILLLNQYVITKYHQFLIGGLLAFTTIKPQLVVLLGIPLAFEIYRRRQWYILSGFISLLSFFLISSFLLMPNWFTQWIEVLKLYSRDNPYTSPIEDFLSIFLSPPIPGKVILAATFVVIFIYGLCLILWLQKKISPLAIITISGAMTFVLDPNGIAYDQIIFLLPVMVMIGISHPPKMIHRLGFVFLILSTWGLFYLDLRGLPWASNRITFLIALPWIIATLFLPSGSHQTGIIAPHEPTRTHPGDA